MSKYIVNTDITKSRIDKNIYGNFAEHLGRCVYEGLWVGKDSNIPNVNGMRKDVVQALKKMKLPLLRWPGGCFADTYHWMDGVGMWSEQTGYWGDPSIEAGRYTRLYAVNDQVFIRSEMVENEHKFVYCSRDFVFGQATRILGFYIYALLNDINVDYSIDGGASWVPVGHIKLDEARRDTYFFSQNLTTLRIRYRITSNADPFRLVWFSPSYIARKRPEVTAYSEF